ncbi:efflux RND transporter permease subunit [Aquibacillus salsiterrae]|uniref:Efflux RND transporter permease subunit n=1 Tax=Aquibacillus salsiterrae TaxID=2950439 RepID=A0A9X3WCB2_9BACI|nr:efflux RND transporter permease subunit [Aquibacillus salsiterrae]MDC3415968.1 efflux RND transporter permease subunit [Aquibacillus salsiterrae]
MKLVDVSVKRPVGVIMIVVAIIALGAISLRNLAIDLFPEIDLPIAVVTTTYEGAAPQEVEQLVSKPIESAISTVQGIDTVQTQSQPNSSLVVMMFQSGTDLDNALLDVREKIDQIKGMLPEDAGDPSVLRFDPQQTPVIYTGLVGKSVEELEEIADDFVIPVYERQEGVGSVTLEGGKTREIQVEINQSKLIQYGLTPSSLVQAINTANQSASAGVLEKGDKDLQVRVEGEYTSVADISNTLIPTRTGATLKLADVATVEDTFKEVSSISKVNGEPAVVLSVLKESGGNTVEVSANVQKAMNEIEDTLPDGVEQKVIIDTADYINQSIGSVLSNMVYGGIFSILVLLLFLKSFRATIVIGLSIPIAVISTFALMYFTGNTLNMLTMGGLALGIGMMVDNSIVILESIVSYRQKGYSRIEAAKQGASELTPAIIASTTTSLVVFLPIVFVEGIASDLFTSLALTVSFSLVASLVVAITLIPMLSSKFLTKALEENGRRYWFDRLLNRVIRMYQKALLSSLKRRKTTLAITTALVAGSLALIPMIGTEFIPAGDQGQISISVETPTGSKLDDTENVTNQVNKELGVYSDIIESNYLAIGSSGNGAGFGGSKNMANYTIQLISSEDRTKTTDEVITELTGAVQDIPGAEITVSAMEAGLGGGSPISIQLTGQDYEVLKELSDQVVYLISTIDGVHNPESSTAEGRPEIQVNVDRNNASQYGLTYQQVMSQVQMAFKGQIATRYREDGNEIDVNIIFPEDKRKTISDLENLQIQTETGSMIPLQTVASLKQLQGPATLTRENQQRRVTVSSDIVGRDLGSITKDIQSELDTLNFPDGYSYSIGGQAQDMAESFSDLGLALIFSIFLVYAVMAIQFESFVQPFIIMFSMPATAVGIFGGLFVTGKPLSITALIGIIMLAGIVVNNAIVLVDYINILRGRGIDRTEAILEAGASRLRPILMTTLTTILGMLPLALGIGEGTETQQPLAIVVIFGLSVSTLFTLILIPTAYLFVEDTIGKLVHLFSRKRKTIE